MTLILTVPQGNILGSFSSLPAPGAVQIPADCVSITCTLTMSAADQTDARNSINWTISVSPDGVSNWKPIYGPESWQGGTHVNHAGATVPNETTFSYGMDPAFRGQFLRADGNVLRRQTVGCTVTSNP